MSEVGWLAAGGEDATAQFHELLPVVELEHLKAFEVLTVPGIFTAWYPRYFAAIERGLTPLRVRRSRVDTEGTVEDNAGILASEIRAPTIVVAQSKGPLDVHAALWMYPSAARNVRAFVSLQGCFGGTPLASDARRTRLWRAAVGGVTRLLGGTPRAYWDMTYQRRRALLARIPQHSPVPTVSLVTVCAQAGPLLERTRRYLLDVHGVESDGFVPAPDAIIPGSRIVRLSGLDHAALALPWWSGTPVNPALIVRALVVLAAG